MVNTLSCLYHSEMHNSLHSSLSQNDLSDTNGSLNSSDSEGELCGIGALCTLRNEYIGQMIIGHLNINSLAEKFILKMCY